MKKKRIMALLTVLTLVFSFTACGGKNGGKPTEESAGESSASGSVSDRFDSLTDGDETFGEESSGEELFAEESSGETSETEETTDEY